MEYYDKVENIGENMMIKELQKKLNKGEGERASNKTDGKCIFCGSEKAIFKYMGKHYCRECYRELQEL